LEQLAQEQGTKLHVRNGAPVVLSFCNEEKNKKITNDRDASGSLSHASADTLG
jgi:hypothetical protein